MAGVGVMGEPSIGGRTMAANSEAPSAVTRELLARRAPVVKTPAVTTGFDRMTPLLGFTLAVTLLYFGQPVLIPLVLAILLSFLLAPIVSLLMRGHVPRGPAVLLAVVVALGLTVAVGAVIVNQASTLAADAPAYAEQISAKASRIRSDAHDRFDVIFRQNDTTNGRRTERARKQGMAALNQKNVTAAVPVEIRTPPPTELEEIKRLVLPVLPPIETGAIVIILSVFILLQKQELRDRLIRLLGSGDLHRTTVALDDAAKRLSRYFLSQFAINATFGAVVWGALYLLGIPSPGLWGILAGLLRFVPYVGIIIAAIPPLALAAAVDPGWSLMLWVGVLFVGLEPIIGYAVEPMLYGKSTGLAPVSVVLAAICWTGLWGPVGLVLSMPMTLMLVVLGRHVPAFEMFDVLLGDRPALTPAEVFYQRVLAGQVDDAVEHAEEQLETMSLARYYDEVALAGLRLAAVDLDRGAVTREALVTVRDNSIEVCTALAGHVDKAAPVATTDTAPSVVCLASRGVLDPAVAVMLGQLLERHGCRVDVVDREGSSGDLQRHLDQGTAEVAALVGLCDERSFRRLAQIAARLQESRPTLRIVAGVPRRDDFVTGAETRGTELWLRPSLTSICEEIGGASTAAAVPHAAAA